MLKNLYLEIIHGGLCFIAGIVLTICAISADKKTTPKTSLVTTVSGNTLSATDFTDQSGVHITADYSGAGSSEITVPLSRIPGAAAWEEKQRGAALCVSPRGAVYALGSYRFDCLNFFGGVRVPILSPSVRDFDLFAGAGWVW